jgi:hypothetical protein
MMHVLSTQTPDLHHIVCTDCLYATERPLPTQQALNQADTHRNTCPRTIPNTRTKTQQTRARKLLSGNY